MTTSLVGNRCDPPEDRSLRRELIWTGATGVIAIALLAGFLGISSQLGSDPLSASNAALAHSLAARRGSGMAVVAQVMSAVSYLPLIGFFAGLRVVISRLDGSGIASTATGIAATLFLAGAITSDGFNLALVVAEHSVPSLNVTAQSARLLAAGWQVSLVEAQVGLAAVCAAVGVAALRPRRTTDMIVIPRWTGVWGVVGAVAVIPLLVAPGAVPVFVVSNLVRFTWILALSVAVLSGARRLPTTTS